MESSHQEDFESEFRYHEREWIVQRIGWVALALLIAAAALGLFGGGILSNARTGEPAVATLSYERFARYAAPVRLELTISPAASASGTVSFEVNESYLSAFEVKSIVPEPRSVETNGERIRFTFESKAAPSTIKLDLLPEKIGSKQAVFTVAGQELRFGQFIYP